VPTVDSIHRKLVHDLFDALERGDVVGVAACYAPVMRMWVNASLQTISRQESIDAVDKGRALHRRRTYDDRVINTFPDGFVVQYTLVVVTHDGTRVALSPCLVGEVRDGQITKLFEYLDTSRFRAPRRRKEEPAA
jgi:ketosteroid isomerase-like protein